MNGFARGWQFGLGMALLAPVWASCLSPLDTLGNETLVTENEELLKENQLEDDKIEDKKPVYDPELEVVEEFSGFCEVTLNKSGSVAKLDVVDFEKLNSHLDGRLFAGRGAAVTALATAGEDLIPSMEVVNGRLKPFNDGLYAAIEIGLQDGVEDLLPSKRQFLYDLLDALAVRLPEAGPKGTLALDSARVFVGAALLAGGNDVDLPSDLKARAQEAHALFLVDGLRARPIGFYTWNETLQEVFGQDRFLQNLTDGLADFAAFAALAVVLKDEAELLAHYQQILALYAGLTNPYGSYSPVDLMPYVDGISKLEDLGPTEVLFVTENPPLTVCAPTPLALLPSSRSKDTEFYAENWCMTPLPAGENFIELFIAAIKSGEVDLAPEADSGWYDYQLWALETLLLPERGPESDHLLLTVAYKKKLIDTFKSIITQNRETHVKQLGGGETSGAPLPPIKIYPLYPVEPFPTFYLRTARGYRFLLPYLQSVLGQDFLGATARLEEDGGQYAVALDVEFGEIIDLLYGLYALSADSVGMRPESYLLAGELENIDLGASRVRARQWLAGWREDADVLKDPRVIVPVSTDDGSGKGVYWAILGVKVIRISAEFVEDFEPEIISTGNLEHYCEVVGMEEHHYYLLVEQMEEVRFSGPPPTRDEFRVICDQHDKAEDIVAALQARQ